MGSCASLLKNEESVASTSLATNATEGASQSITTHHHFSMPTTPTTHHHGVRRNNSNTTNVDGFPTKHTDDDDGDHNNRTVMVNPMMQLPMVASTGSPLHIPGVDGDTAEGDIDDSNTTPSLEDTKVFYSARGTFEMSNPLHHHHQQQHQHPLSGIRSRNSNQLTNSSSLKYSKSADEDADGTGGVRSLDDDSLVISNNGGGIISMTALLSTPSPHLANSSTNTRPAHHHTSPIPPPSPMGDSGFSALTLPSDRNTSIISGSGAGGVGCGWGSSMRGGDGVLSGSTTPRAHVDLFSGCGGAADRRGSLSSGHQGVGVHPPHLSLQAQLRIAEAEFESSSQHGGHNSSHTNLGSATTPTSVSNVVDTIRKLSLTNRASFLTSSTGLVGGGGGGVSLSRPDISHATISPDPSSPVHQIPRSSFTSTALHFTNNSSSVVANNSMLVHPPLGHLRRLSSSGTQQHQVPRLWHLNRRLHHQNRNASTTSGSTAATCNNGCGGMSASNQVLGGLMTSTSTMALSGGGYQSVPLYLSTSPATSPSNQQQHNNRTHHTSHNNNSNNCAFASSIGTPPQAISSIPSPATSGGGGFKSILPDRAVAKSPTHFGLPATDTPSPTNRHSQKLRNRSIASRGSGGSTGYFPPISTLNSSGTGAGCGGGGGGSATTPLNTSTTVFDVSAYSSASLRASSPQPGQRVMAALHRLAGGARFRREITCDPHGTLKPAIVLESTWGGGGSGRGGGATPTNNNSSSGHHSGSGPHHQRYRRSSLGHQHLVASVQSMHISPLISAADLVFGHQHDSQSSMLMLDPNTVYGSSNNTSPITSSHRRETPSNFEIDKKIREFTLPPAVAASSAQDIEVDADDDDSDENVIRSANLFHRDQGSSSSSSSSTKNIGTRNIISRGGAVVEDCTDDSNRTDPGANSFHTLGPRYAPCHGMADDATSVSTSPSPDTVHLLPFGTGSTGYEDELEPIKSNSQKHTTTATTIMTATTARASRNSPSITGAPYLPALKRDGGSSMDEHGSSSLLIHSSTMVGCVNRPTMGITSTTTATGLKETK